MSQAVFSNYLIDTMLNCVYKNTPFTGPATVYAALFTTEPLPAASGTEVTGGSYARTAVTWGAVTSHSLKNSANIVFPAATGSWGSVAWVALFDAASSGNMLTYAPLTSAITVGSGTTFQINTNNLTAAWF